LSQAKLIEPEDGSAPYVITLQTDISARRHLEAELERKASHDDLTGLWNRAALHQHLEPLLQRRDPPLVACLFIDLDDFKTVNDVFGHDAGDQLLAHVANRLRNNLRAGDIAARVGGDEFVLVCDVASGSEAVGIAERIRYAIQDGFHYDEQAIGITASVGVALSQPRDDVRTLTQRADMAAYIAKRAGKARTEIIGIEERQNQ
jgi:diguanylate cyclase (GGDEF)-like protein